MSIDTSTAPHPPAIPAGPNAFRRAVATPIAGPVAALVVAAVFFSIFADHFLAGSNFAAILQQVMVTATLGIGQTLIILTAGIDLACGAIMALGSIVMTKMAVEAGLNPYLAMLAGLVVCGLLGVVTGLLVTRIALPPFIVTLGMLSIATATTLIVSGGQTIGPAPDSMAALGNTFSLFGVPVMYGVVVMLLLFLIFSYVLGSTAWGRRVYAIGANAEGARLAGVPVRKILVSIYAVAGIIYGIAAILAVSRTGGFGNPQDASGTYNLDSITAVVLGGTSLFGGRGLVVGTLLGALVVGVFATGLQLMHLDSTYQVLVTGVLVILAVAVDQFSRRKVR